MKRALIKRLTWLAVLLCAGCAAVVNLHYDKNKPHHTPAGFRNNYLANLNNGSGNFWKWQWQRFGAGLPKPPANNYQFPRVKPDVARLKANRSETTATWIGHATVLLQVAGVNILTDPHLTERASPVSFAGPKRVVPPALSFDELPHIDMVVISHNHYDHLDLGTVQRLAQQTGGTLPAGSASAGAAAAPFSFFFAGDTGYSKDFADIAARLGAVDFAMIPLGAYEPRWFMAPQHADPPESVKIHRDLQAQTSLGIHWGTFELTDEPLDEPPARLAVELAKAAIAPERFRVLMHGETMDPRK